MFFLAHMHYESASESLKEPPRDTQSHQTEEVNPELSQDTSTETSITSRNNLPSTHNSSIEQAIDLTIKITELVIQCKDPSHQDLRHELANLNRALDGANILCQTFDDIYLGRILAHKVNLEVKACLAVLQKLFSRISRRRECLESIVLRWLRPHSGLDKDQLDLFIEKLSARYHSLVFIPITLHSYVFTHPSFFSVR